VHYDGAKLQNCVVRKFCTNSGQSLLSMLGTRERNFSFHFKRYNLTIRAINFFETFCTCSPSSLGQDLVVKIAFFYFLFFYFFFASWVRNGRFEHFSEKNDLCPLGVKKKERTRFSWGVCMNKVHVLILPNICLCLI
jgi:hypothetical protein